MATLNEIVFLRSRHGDDVVALTIADRPTLSLRPEECLAAAALAAQRQPAITRSLV